MNNLSLPAAIRVGSQGTHQTASHYFTAHGGACALGAAMLATGIIAPESDDNNMEQVNAALDALFARYPELQMNVVTAHGGRVDLFARINYMNIHMSRQDIADCVEQLERVEKDGKTYLRERVQEAAPFA